jgi:hypothetical protein
MLTICLPSLLKPCKSSALPSRLTIVFEVLPVPKASQQPRLPRVIALFFLSLLNGFNFGNQPRNDSAIIHTQDLALRPIHPRCLVAPGIHPSVDDNYIWVSKGGFYRRTIDPDREFKRQPRSQG